MIIGGMGGGGGLGSMMEDIMHLVSLISAFLSGPARTFLLGQASR